jgi:Uma2 family endonuclease
MYSATAIPGRSPSPIVPASSLSDIIEPPRSAIPMVLNIQPLALAVDPALAPEPIWPLTIAQFHQMIAAGILTDEDPVEFLEGLLVTKMPKNPPHRLSTQLTREYLARILPIDWFVEAQEPITIDNSSEPEPDISVIRGSRRDYSDRHPGPEDIGLIIEVADATLQRDRNRKTRIYAKAGISIYWIINLVDRQIEVYSQPDSGVTPATYLQRQDYRSEDMLPIVLAGQKIDQVLVRELLP